MFYVTTNKMGDNSFFILFVVDVLRYCTKDFTPTLITQVNDQFGSNPFLILISCLLSLRAKDSQTIHVTKELFKIAQTPQEILDIPTKKLENIIYEIGFYKNKAKTLRHVCQTLIDKFDGKVPKTQEELLSIKGVGLKTANLVLGLAFNIPAICVDIHVHRISNRLGIVKTKNPDETENALKKILPKKYWIEWNDLLVKWGQNICTPTSPKCSTCQISKYCQKIGVIKHR